jgi:hypothetical protein
VNSIWKALSALLATVLGTGSLVSLFELEGWWVQALPPAAVATLAAWQCATIMRVIDATEENRFGAPPARRRRAGAAPWWSRVVRSARARRGPRSDRPTNGA